jgi:antitoxin component of RelBE/YafQ-DinJ toxin-antitoxin module
MEVSKGGGIKMPKFITIDSQLAKSVEPVLNELGIDVETVIKMTLKRIARDQDISFLMAKQQEQPVAPPAVQPVQLGEERISKTRAISLFETQGIRFTRNVTFASKNRSSNNYWANPYFFALDSDWYLILNDWQRRELHLFLIPGGAIPRQRMVCRIDQQDKIDLQISYNDPTFTDTRSKISFMNYRIESVRY